MNEDKKIWDKGFEDGLEFCRAYFNPKTGMMQPFPKKYVHRGDLWSKGFGEGVISGTIRKFKEAYPNFKSISWNKKTNQYDVVY